jgi:stage V sporulation protein B
MKKQSLIKGTVILGIAGVFSKFLGLFFRWPLIMLIGDEGMAYYQISYPLYMFFIGLATGMPVAVSKMVSERNVLHDEEGIIQVVNKALLVMLILGGGFSFVFLVFAKPLIEFFKWDPKTYYALIGIGMAPVFISIMSVFRGFFQGLQNMTPTAISQLIEQLGRIVFGVGIAYILLGKGIEFSAGGAAFGAAAGGLLGLMYLSSRYHKIKKSFKIKRVGKNFGIMEELLRMAIPISLGAAMGTIMNVFDSILVPQKLLQAGFSYKEMNILYGQLTGKAMVLVNVPLTLSIALCASLVPIIAESRIMNKYMDVINKVETTIKVSTTIALPAALGLFFMSHPILKLLFPGHSDGYLILKYAALSIPLIILTQTSTAILQGTGYYIIPIRNLVVGCITKILITITLVSIPSINIYGAVIGTIVGYFITSVLNMIALRRKLNVSINYYDTTIKPAYASVIMIIVVVFLYNNVYNYTMSNGSACIISIFGGVTIYGIIIVLLGVFKYSYVKSKILKKGHLK